MGPRGGLYILEQRKPLGPSRIPTSVHPICRLDTIILSWYVTVIGYSVTLQFFINLCCHLTTDEMYESHCERHGKNLPEIHPIVLQILRQ